MSKRVFNYITGEIIHIPDETNDVGEEKDVIFNPETNEIIRKKKSFQVQKLQETYNRSMHPGKAPKNINIIESPRGKRKSKSAAKFWATVFVTAAIGVTAIIGAPKIGEKIDDWKLNQKVTDYYSQFQYAYYVDSSHGKTIAYRDDWTAEYLASATDADIDTMIYYIYNSYDYYPEKHINAVFDRLSIYNTENAEAIKGFKDFDEYINSLGFKNADDYRKGYEDEALGEIKRQAQIHQHDEEYPFQYDYNTDNYSVTDKRMVYDFGSGKYITNEGSKGR